MTPNDITEGSLQQTIKEDKFFEIDDVTVLEEIYKAFSPEIDRLKNAYAIPEPGFSSKPVLNGRHEISRSPSQIIYNEDFDEVNRTLVGVLALRWIHNNQFEVFTGCQPENVKLTRESFDWLRSLFSDSLKTPEDLFALVMSMVINDLGKDPHLAEDYYSKTGDQVRDMNHDMVLLEAAKVGMVPCLDQLDDDHRTSIMLGLELGSELNAGQLAQAENVPINLEGLLHMSGHEHAYALKFMEQILDVAGASGHVDHTCAKKLIEPVFQSFKTVYEVSLDIIQRKSSLREGYDKVLTKRGDMLSRSGFRRLTVRDPEQRALLRLLTMGRTADKEQAELFDAAFNGLDEHKKKMLVDGLNIDGGIDETAVLPYYMPAMISEALENTRDVPQKDKERALASLMWYLARVLQHKNSADETGGGLHPFQGIQRQRTGLPGIVIERNVREVRDTISSDTFRTNPDTLDDLPIPKGEILKRRRASYSS
jgi:hypothetical protein